MNEKMLPLEEMAKKFDLEKYYNNEFSEVFKENVETILIDDFDLLDFDGKKIDELKLKLFEIVETLNDDDTQYELQFVKFQGAKWYSIRMKKFAFN